MNCPKCNTALLMSDKHGVEIDYCPTCRGIWLDRGELEKIIEREFSMSSQNKSYNHDDDYEDNDHRKKHYQDNDDLYPYKRKKSFLSELFDF